MDRDALQESAEHRRLADSRARRADWKRWGPYLADRAWGTVREDYSADGDAWRYFPFDHAHLRAYRWNEDGLGGFCDREQQLCLGVALWNGRDPILKERLFGLANPEGNHGEDVKEHYYHLDGLPSHAYMRMLYRYPQVPFPYAELRRESAHRGRDQPEYELVEALREALRAQRFFDLEIVYAKAAEADLLCRLSATNRGPETATLELLPQLWYRNTWSWEPGALRPSLEQAGPGLVRCEHPALGERWWAVEGEPELLFTDNDSNNERLFGTPNPGPYVKDGIGQAVIEKRSEAVNPERRGTKVAARRTVTLAPGERAVVRIRFSDARPSRPFAGFDAIVAERAGEADAFYLALQPSELDAEPRALQRQAFAGLLWSKSFYHYRVQRWLEGDPGQPAPPDTRRRGRNQDWTHVNNMAVLSVPDAWEYPWFAAWDLAFHTVPLALIDPEWAKRQLVLILREWYMHPNGQLPSYEWSLGDVNPPVHAWAAWRVYQLDRERSGAADTVFLERVFHKLLLNFTWWVNRKDHDGNNVFQGGFLGLDNIGIFDRNAPLPTGGHLEQADGTAWMGMYCLNMLAIALELAQVKPAYEDVATKFFVHFLYIANSINRECGQRGLWDDRDGFYYDLVHTPDGAFHPLRIRSFVGLIPLFAVETLEPEVLERLPAFSRRMAWLIEHRPYLIEQAASLTEPGMAGRRLLALADRGRLERALQRMLDEVQFLSPYGLRSLSKEHRHQPYELTLDGRLYRVAYEPGASRSGLFGGNSNWRGPIWFPVNFLMIEALQRYHRYYGDTLTVAFPSGSERRLTLDRVAAELAQRLVGLFLENGEGRRPFQGDDPLFQDPLWRDLPLFHEYFHGDSGRGLGASHQTGWTALVAQLIEQWAARP